MKVSRTGFSVALFVVVVSTVFSAADDSPPLPALRSGQPAGVRWACGKIAVAKWRAKEYAGAAYYFSWYLSIARPDSPNIAIVKRNLDGTLKHLTDAQRKIIATKTDGFSEYDGTQFVLGTPGRTTQMMVMPLYHRAREFNDADMARFELGDVPKPTLTLDDIRERLPVTPPGGRRGDLFRQLAGHGSKAIPILVKEIGDEKEERTRKELLGMLLLIVRASGDKDDIGQAFPILVDALDWYESPYDIVAAFAQFEPGTVVPVLCRILSDPAGEKAFGPQTRDERKMTFQRGAAMRVIRHLGPKAAQSIPVLEKVFTFNQPMEMPNAVSAMAAIGPAALPTLQRLLDSDSRAMREHALTALALMGKDAAPAIPRIRQELDGDLRALAVVTLPAIGATDAKTREGLVRLLDDYDATVRYHALMQLDRVGPITPQARDKIQAMSESDPAGHIRRLAIATLGKIGGSVGDNKTALDLAKRVDGKDYQARLDAARALAQMGPDALPALPALVRFMKAPENVRHAGVAAEAIGAIGPSASDAIPALVEALHLDTPAAPAVQEAAKALGRMGVRGAEPLLRALGKKHYATRRDVKVALASIGAPVVPALRTIATSTSGLAEEARSALWSVYYAYAIHSAEGKASPLGKRLRVLIEQTRALNSLHPKPDGYPEKLAGLQAEMDAAWLSAKPDSGKPVVSVPAELLIPTPEPVARPADKPKPAPGLGDAAAVYRSVSPAILRIGNIEAQSTGALISKDGLILATAAVAGSPLAITAEIPSATREGKVFRTQDVTVVGLNPIYDLALMKVDMPKDLAVDPLRMPFDEPVHAPPAAGARLYAFAQGGTMGARLECSVTDGVFSHLDREWRGAHLIQFDAELVDDTAGTVLCDSAGRLQGMVVKKLLREELTGFAAPARLLTRGSFDRKPFIRLDDETAATYMGFGDKYLQRLDHAASPAGRAELLADALKSYRKALGFAPRHAPALFRIGRIHYERRDDETYRAKALPLAEAYLRRSLEFEPTPPTDGPHYFLGATMQAQGRADDAEQVWRQGLKQLPDGAHRCAYQLGQVMSKRGDAAAAAGFAHQAMQILDEEKQGDAWKEARVLYSESLLKLSPEQQRLVQQRANPRAGAGEGGSAGQATPDADGPMALPFPAIRPSAGGAFGSKSKALGVLGSSKWGLSQYRGGLLKDVKRVPWVQCEHKVVTFEGVGTSMTLSPNGEDLFITLRDQEEVAVRDARTLDLKGTIRCPRVPVQVLRDGEQLFAACKEEKTVVAIDPATHEIVKTFTFELPAARLSPWAPKGYFSVTLSDKGKQEQWLVHISSGKRIKLFETSAIASAISTGDGRIWVVQAPGDSVSMYDANRRTFVDKDSMPTFPDLPPWHTFGRYGSFKPLPNGRGFTCGDRRSHDTLVVSADLSRLEGRLPGRVQHLVHEQDLAVSRIGTYVLAYVSTRSGRTLQLARLNRDGHSARGLKGPHYPTDFNAATETFYQLADNRVQWFRIGPGAQPIKPLEEQASAAPAARAIRQLPKTVEVGDVVEFDASEGSGAGGSYRLGSHPPDMTIDPRTGKIRWQAPLTAIGIYDIEIFRTSAAGESARVLKHTIQIKPQGED